MVIGVISDTHDNLTQINKAVKFFNDRKVGLVLHAGDYVAPFAVLRLNKLEMPWQGVFGNNDGEKQGLAKVSENRIKPAPLRLKLDNRNITVVHDINQLNLEKEKADIIVYGHTHKPQIIKKPNGIVINPGESCGWLSEKPTVALVDLDVLKAEIIEI